jgi:hypothetical protein
MRIWIFLCSLFFVSCTSSSNKIDTKEISEASGLLFSTKYPNVLWTHNDSGDKPYLYAVDTKTFQLISKIKIDDAKHKDWEDLSYHKGQIVIGDFGNNQSNREHLRLYLIDEPNPYESKKEKVRKEIAFSYSDQTGSKIKNYDCEAVFSFNENLFLLTKHREDRNTTLYRLEHTVAQKIIDFNTDGKVTAADANEKFIVVLTYDALYLLEPSLRSENFFDGKIYKKKIKAGKAEGVAFHNDKIHVINEKAELFTYSIDDIIKG